AERRVLPAARRRVRARPERNGRDLPLAAVLWAGAKLNFPLFRPAMQQSSPLRVAFFWRSLGPHHAARMAALAERPELAAAGPLRVVERFPGGDPERAWRADRGALRGKLDLLGWEEALRREDWGEFDAAVFPGWAERDFLR